MENCQWKCYFLICYVKYIVFLEVLHWCDSTFLLEEQWVENRVVVESAVAYNMKVFFIIHCRNMTFSTVYKYSNILILLWQISDPFIFVHLSEMLYSFRNFFIRG